MLYEWNQLDEADASLQKAITLAQRSGNRELESSAYRKLALLAQATGDQSAVSIALALAKRAAGDDAPQITRARNQAAAVVIALAQNDLETARRWADQMQTTASASLFYVPLFLIPARLHLAQGNKPAAGKHLAVEYEKASGAGWRYGQIEIRSLQALAASSVDDALHYLADALTMAQPEGFVRTFIDKGEHLIPLLHMATGRQLHSDYCRSLLAEFSEKLPLPSPPVALDSAENPLIETISEREIDVLVLLADGLTYQEIAQSMFVSVNTVKSHLKSIYGKLGVHNRREAVARARALHLLAPHK